MKPITHWKEKCVVLAVLAAFVALVWLLKLPCPWQALFAIPCPGCGMTRAWVCALTLQFSQAVVLHPMFWSVPLILVWWLLDGRVTGRKFWDIGIPVVILLGFLIQWVVRLTTGY